MRNGEFTNHTQARSFRNSIRNLGEKATRGAFLTFLVVCVPLPRAFMVLRAQVEPLCPLSDATELTSFKSKHPEHR